MSSPAGKKSRRLRPGDLVEIKSAAEVLATLDGDAAVDRMPFMPEMARFAGKRFRVSRRVDKICDTIARTGSRRIENTVYLEDLRCDGSGHAGCQAGCKIYWKEAWLRRVDGEDAKADVADPGQEKLEQLARLGTRTTRELDGVNCEVWRCQATEAFKASTHLRGFDPRPHWRELTNGNFGPLQFTRILFRMIGMRIAQSLGLQPPLPLHGTGSLKRPPVNVQRGDLVQVRSPAEIAPTLDESGLDRGLSFDREMLPYCGQTLRVRERVQKIVDDKTGRLLNIKRDCLILEGSVCSGERTIGCWFCPREIYAFWRESWVRPVDMAEADNLAAPAERSMTRVGEP